MLSTVAFLNGKKWTSMLIKQTYFGNWLRDYSQAVDVGSLKGVNAATIRILVRLTSIDSLHRIYLCANGQLGLGAIVHGFRLCYGGV